MTPEVGLGDQVEDMRGRVDAALDQFLVTVAAEFSEQGSRAVVDELKRVVFSGGKRLRPVFCCLGFLASGEKPSQPIINAAASLELLHTLAIVHDDLMDGSSRRRGVPTAMASLAVDDSGGAGLGRAASMAVLVGDLALVLSDRLFAESGFPSGTLARGWPPLGRLRQDAIAGQYLDLSNSGRLPSLELAGTIARLKTGSYTVKGPLLVGAALAGASEEVQSALAAYGDAIGLAFQLTDDLLGLFGNPAVTGKDIDSDIRLGKPTWLMAKVAELASDSERQVLLSIFDQSDAPPEQIDEVRKIATDCGARRAAEDEAIRQVGVACDCLRTQADLDDITCRTLVGIAGALRFRES